MAAQFYNSSHPNNQTDSLASAAGPLLFVLRPPGFLDGTERWLKGEKLQMARAIRSRVEGS